MKRAMLIFKSETIRYLINLKKYWLSTLVMGIMMFVVFMGVYIASGGFSENKDLNFINSQIVGYFFYYIISMFFSYLESDIRGSITIGIFEQTLLNKSSLSLIVLIKSIIAFLFALIEGIPVFILMFLFTGYLKIYVNTHLIIVFILTIGGVYGIGLIMGGLALRFKRIGQLPFIIQIIFLGMSSLPLSNLPSPIQNILLFFPFQKGILLLKELGVNNIIQVPTSDLIILLVNCLVYLLLGIITFKYFEYVSKKKGILGYY